jgi:hypothetical protein
MSKPTIQFRCWYCNRKHEMPMKGIGKTVRCSCGYDLRVPRYSGGKCRMKTLADWAVEALVYGGGGALLGGGLGLLFTAAVFGVGFGARTVGVGADAGIWLFVLSWGLIVGLACLGFLIGLLFGERGINWFGRFIRKVDSDEW